MRRIVGRSWREGKRMDRWYTMTFKAVKQLFMILSWGNQDIIYLFKPIEYKMCKVYPNVNYELWVIVKVHQL